MDDEHLGALQLPSPQIDWDLILISRERLRRAHAATGHWSQPMEAPPPECVCPPRAYLLAWVDGRVQILALFPDLTLANLDEAWRLLPATHKPPAELWLLEDSRITALRPVWPPE